jgi:hypothetical protein
MRTGIVLVGVLCAAAAAAQERAAQPVTGRIDLDSIAALVVTFASCAALHAAAAEALERAALLPYAATARRRAGVDQLAVAYLLAEDRVAKGGTPRELASFTDYVEQLTAAARERMVAVVEDPDPAAYKREENICASLIPLEDEILSKLGAD